MIIISTCTTDGWERDCVGSAYKISITCFVETALDYWSNSYFNINYKAITYMY